MLVNHCTVYTDTGYLFTVPLYSTVQLGGGGGDGVMVTGTGVACKCGEDVCVFMWVCVCVGKLGKIHALREKGTYGKSLAKS